MIFPESVRERAAAALLGGGVGSSLLGWGRPNPARGRRRAVPRRRRGCHRAGGPHAGLGEPRTERPAGAFGVLARGLRHPRPSLELFARTRGLVPCGEGTALPHLRLGLPRTDTGTAVGAGGREQPRTCAESPALARCLR